MKRYLLGSLLAGFAFLAMAQSTVLGQVQPPTKPPKDIKPVKISDEEYRIGKLSFNPKTKEICSLAE